MERLQDRSRSFSGDTRPYQKVDVIDPYTVKFSFAKPSGHLRMLAQFEGRQRSSAKEAVEQNGDLARPAWAPGRS